MRARRPHDDIRHALVTDAVALLSHSGGDGPQRLFLRPQGDHFPDRLLLGLMRDEFAIVAEVKRFLFTVRQRLAA
jgi:hypothetical protein